MINARCKVAPMAPQQKHRERLGTIIGESYNSQSWIVLWDGLRQSQSYAKDFIEVVQEAKE